MAEIVIVLFASWAVWKSLQGWFRWRVILRQQRQIAVVRDELRRVTKLGTPTSPAKPMHMGHTMSGPIDLDWPELIN